MQSAGFDLPKDAGRAIGVLKQARTGDELQTPEIQEVLVPVEDVLAALAAMREAA